jgi:PAS domain S-box-containing protein
MDNNPSVRRFFIKSGRFAWGIGGMWTLIIAASLVLNIVPLNRNALEAATIHARVAHDKDVLYRRWNSSHGGVYVPVSEDTQPNPYLSDIVDRDVITPSGTLLTMMNPAYMTRQVHELAKLETGVQGHITSLDPVRPENAADPWETQALLAFEKGEMEYSSVEEMDGVSYLRFMRPLVTEEGCLDCHAAQGYRVGDIRGGISVSVPMEPYSAIQRQQISLVWFAHSVLWGVGIAGTLFANQRFQINERQRSIGEQALKDSEARLQSIFRVAPIGIGLIGENRQILWVNEMMCKISGYQPADLVENNARMLYPTEQQYMYVGREKYRQIGELGTGSVETQWLRKDGAIIDVLLSSTPLNADDLSVGVTFTALDITDRVGAENQLQHRADQLEILRQASLNVTEKLTLNAVLDAILVQAMRLVTADDAHIFLYEDDQLRFGAVRWADGRQTELFAEPRQDGLTYSVARSGERLAISNMREHPLFRDWPLDGAILGLPLKIGAQVVGVMNIALDQPYEFTDNDLSVLELLADQAAIAIENAHLHEQVQDHAQSLEQHVEDRTAELKILVGSMAGREVRMSELKKVISTLRKQLIEAGMEPEADDPLNEPLP